MATEKMPEWPDAPSWNPNVCMEYEAAYQEARAEAAIARLRSSVALLKELADGDDWIMAAVNRHLSLIGEIPE